MKKLALLYFTVLFNYTVMAQANSNNGIRFFNGSWKAVLAEAAQQHKMIFVDVYTEWCGPCKYMDQSVFTTQAVGNKYNPLFISYKLDAEKGEGIALAKKYGITAYPTFLFLNSGGYLVHKVIGEKEEQPFIGIAQAAVIAGADDNNLGNLEKNFAEGNRNPGFLRNYLDRLTAIDADNSVVLDEYFKRLPPETLGQDSTLLYLAGHVTGTKTAALQYLMEHYEQLSNQSKAEVTNRLFEKLVRYGAGLALKEKRLEDYAELANFAWQLYDLNNGQYAFMNRLNLAYSGMVKDYPQLKDAGYTLAANLLLVHTDSIRAEDARRYQNIMRPYLTGEKDSTKIPGFSEEKSYLVNLYTREITEQLYTPAQAFTQLPATEKKALADALQWAKRCYELMPDKKAFADLVQVLDDKIKQ